MMAPSPILEALGRSLMAKPTAPGWIDALRRQQLALSFILQAVRTIEGEDHAFACSSNEGGSGRLDDVAARLARVEEDMPDLAELACIAGMSIYVQIGRAWCRESG